MQLSFLRPELQIRCQYDHRTVMDPINESSLKNGHIAIISCHYKGKKTFVASVLHPWATKCFQQGSPLNLFLIKQTFSFNSLTHFELGVQIENFSATSNGGMPAYLIGTDMAKIMPGFDRLLLHSNMSWVFSLEEKLTFQVPKDDKIYVCLIKKLLFPRCIILRCQRLEDKQCRST